MSRTVPTPAVVVVTARSFSTGTLDLTGRLQRAGCEVVKAPTDHALDDLAPSLARATAWIAGTGPVTPAHFAAAPKLRILARHGVGTEAVDLAAAAAHGVLVTNTPGANTEAVADLAVALMLGALRDVVAGARRVRSGDWSVRRSRELGELTVGIVGLGRIGRAVARRLAGFAPELLGHDPYADPSALPQDLTLVDLDALLESSDIVTLHAPGDQQLIDRRSVQLISPDAILVNTARASLVDETAIADALREDRLRSYATDVLAGEGEHGSRNPLLAPDLADRTIVTPHSGAQTVQAVDLMGGGAVDAVLAYLRGDPPPNQVSMPDVARPAAGGAV